MIIECREKVNMHEKLVICVEFVKVERELFFSFFFLKEEEILKLYKRKL